MQIVNSKLKYFDVFSGFSSEESEFCIEEKFGIKLKYFDVFSGVSSEESEFCIEEKLGIKLALVSISHVTLLQNPKEQPFCFIKK